VDCFQYQKVDILNKENIEINKENSKSMKKDIKMNKNIYK
jgi:hypothetical protein